MFRRTLKLVLVSRAPGRVLDVGSGTGFYVERWRELGAESIMASDLTAAATARLRGLFPGVEVVRLDVSAGAPPELIGRFDAISAMDILFHIVEDTAYRCAFSTLAAMLRRGGLLVISEDFLHGTRSVQPHRVSRPLHEVEAAAREAGLEPLLRRPIFFLMNTPHDARSRLLRRWWSRLSYELYRSERRGAVLGPILFPVELALGRLRAEGPSTELMVCRKL